MRPRKSTSLKQENEHGTLGNKWHRGLNKAAAHNAISRKASATYGILFIFRADNEGELKMPSFVVVWDKLWFCATSQKEQAETYWIKGNSDMSWVFWKDLARNKGTQGTHKWKKGRNYSQSREKPKELLMCNLSPANYGKVTHFLVFIFASYVIACLQKDLEQISLEWLSQIQKPGGKNLTGKTAFSFCTHLNRQKYGLFIIGHQSYHLTLGQIQYTNSGFFFHFSKEKSSNKQINKGLWMVCW